MAASRGAKFFATGALGLPLLHRCPLPPHRLYVDETRPRWMIDGTGRSIKYLGALQLRLDIPRALARTDDDEEWLVLDG